MRAEQSRADNIDILKAICAFLIVCIHIPFPGTIGAYFTALTRIAVPIFFMITGYFYKDTIAAGKEKRQIRKILRLFLISNLVYLVWNCTLYAIRIREGVIGYLSDIFSLKSLLKFMLLNDSPFSGHLWYLGAILYVLVIIYCLDKIHCRKCLYWIAPFLLAVDLILGKYSMVLFHREFPYILVRNFLFVGLPYFCIGCVLRDNFDKIKKHSKMMPIGVVIFSITTLLERFILENLQLNTTRDHYISTTFLAIAVFGLMLSRDTSAHSHCEKMLAEVGRRYSTWIYILHPFFIKVIEFVVEKIGMERVFRYVAPFVIYFVTLLFLAGLSKYVGWPAPKKNKLKR